MITEKFNNSFIVSKSGLHSSNPIFLLNYTHYCVDSLSKYYFKTIYVDRFFWVKPFLYSLLDLSNLSFYLIDGVQFKYKDRHLIVQYNSNTMLTSNHLNFFTTIPLACLNLISIASLLRSSTWLERELSEFSGITFLGLLDTRKLLLDYFEFKQIWQTHIGNDKYYNSNLYDITLIF